MRQARLAPEESQTAMELMVDQETGEKLCGPAPLSPRSSLGRPDLMGDQVTTACEYKSILARITYL